MSQRLCTATFLWALCVSHVGHARPVGADHRQQAQALVAQIIEGGSVEPAIAKLHYLGEERYAAQKLADWAKGGGESRGRQAVLFALSELATPQVEPILLEMASDGDSVVRMNAARGLGRIRSRQTGTLLRLAKDPNPAVRREAADALGKSGDRRAGMALLQAARKEDQPEVRAALLRASGQSGDHRVARRLAEFLRSDSESTRYAAAQGLCQLKSPACEAFANALLQKSDRYARKRAVLLYEGVPAKAAQKFLLPLLSDPDRGVAACAARILYQGGRRDMLVWLLSASHQAKGTDRDRIEDEIERLHLSDEERNAAWVVGGGR